MKTGTVLAAAAGAALVALYLRSLWLLVANGFLASAGAFQIAMILLQASKLIIVMSAQRLRDGNMIMIFDIFSIELLTLPILVLAGLLTGVSSFAGIEVALFSTWPLALAVVFVPFAAFRVARAMLSDGLPSEVVPGAVLVSGLTAFTGLVATVPGLGTTDFTRALVGGFISSAGTISPLALDPVTEAALPLLFTSIVVYAAIGRAAPGGSMIPALILALVSTVIVLVWTAAVISVPGAVFYFIAPTFGLLAVVWWSGRGR